MDNTPELTAKELAEAVAVCDAVAIETNTPELRQFVAESLLSRGYTDLSSKILDLLPDQMESLAEHIRREQVNQPPSNT